MSIRNLKFSYKKDNTTLCRHQNLLNDTQNNPFLIARANDPFDRQHRSDANGDILATPNNPNALSFDPTYLYPNQEDDFIGLNYNLTMKAPSLNVLSLNSLWNFPHWPTAMGVATALLMLEIHTVYVIVTDVFLQFSK